MKELANSKADANITVLKMKLIQLEYQYNKDILGGITKDEFKLVIDGNKKELKVWEYIKTKIE